MTSEWRSKLGLIAAIGFGALVVFGVRELLG